MDLIPKDLRSLAIERYDHVMEHGDSPVLTVKTQRVNGEVVWVKIQDRLLMYQGEKCVMTVLIDITEEVELREAYKKSAEAEQKARLELENLQSILVEREKQTAINSLLTGVSHQLNTPLGNIRTSSTLVEGILRSTLDRLATKSLRESELVGALNDALEAMYVIDKSAIKSSDLIKNVKFMVAKKPDIEKSSFRFSTIILDIVRLYSQDDKHSGIEVSMDIDENISTVSNPNTWMKLLSVFCENAIQHGFAGEYNGLLNISAKFADTHFEFRFSDNGAGIAADKQERIFEAFYSSQMGSSSGLGLALAYNIVTRLLDGTIRVESEGPGFGTTFIVTLPKDDFTTKPNLKS